jgi:hypothetical protein
MFQAWRERWFARRPAVVVPAELGAAGPEQPVYATALDL